MGYVLCAGYRKLRLIMWFTALIMLQLEHLFCNILEGIMFLFNSQPSWSLTIAFQPWFNLLLLLGIRSKFSEAISIEWMAVWNCVLVGWIATSRIPTIKLDLDLGPICQYSLRNIRVHIAVDRDTDLSGNNWTFHNGWRYSSWRSRRDIPPTWLYAKPMHSGPFDTQVTIWPLRHTNARRWLDFVCLWLRIPKDKPVLNISNAIGHFIR